MYKIFVTEIAKLNPEKDYSSMALSPFSDIPGIGTSFATKHLKFWGSFPIYDQRIAYLLYPLNENNKPNWTSRINKKAINIYDKYLDDIRFISKLNNNFPVSEIEKALFAFSENFFNG